MSAGFAFEFNDDDSANEMEIDGEVGKTAETETETDDRQKVAPRLIPLDAIVCLLRLPSFGCSLRHNEQRLLINALRLLELSFARGVCQFITCIAFQFIFLKPFLPFWILLLRNMFYRYCLPYTFIVRCAISFLTSN